MNTACPPPPPPPPVSNLFSSVKWPSAMESTSTAPCLGPILEAPACEMCPRHFDI